MPPENPVRSAQIHADKALKRGLVGKYPVAPEMIQAQVMQKHDPGQVFGPRSATTADTGPLGAGPEGNGSLLAIRGRRALVGCVGSIAMAIRGGIPVIRGGVTLDLVS